MDHWSCGCSCHFILSPWLSHLTFGNKEYTAAFMWLSVTLLFNQLTSGQDVLNKDALNLAKDGSFVGLVISAPLLLLLSSVDGIVPAIILTALFISHYLVFCKENKNVRPEVRRLFFREKE
jgi:hypothetical protein